jgi:Flp pilus assembly protein TadG
VTRRHHSPPASPLRRRLLRRDQSGAAAVEFALVVGLFVFILYGLIAFGMILATKQRITNAAAEGARAAVGATNAADAKSAAIARVTAAGLPAGTYTIGPDPLGEPRVFSCGTYQCIEVTITYNLAGNPVVPPAPGLGLVTPNTITSTAVVQYR